MVTHRYRRWAAVTVAFATAIWLAIAVAPAASAHESGALYVSAHGSSAKSGHSCKSARYSSISDAVSAANSWDTVIVCHGTYRENVLVAKPLHLVGRGATIDATGLENAIHVVASHVSVEGFRLENANGEGLLVGADTPDDIALLPKSTVVSHVSVSYVAAIHNDQGFNGTEQGNCAYPGDCGGGIHFNVVAWSSIRNSAVLDNADGILVTDDYGPTSHNSISNNVVNDNTTECGIVLASHNGGAVSFDPNTFALTGRNPSVGGIYDNVIRDNVTNRNGTAKAPPEFGGGGSGSGIGIFGAFQGTGAYDNLVKHNYAAGNGMAGFTIHAHLPGGEDVSGNAIVDNTFDTNNVGGDGFDGPPGPTDFQTTGIAVYSAALAHMTIRDNKIRNNAIGIWLSNSVTAKGLHDNKFRNVTTKIVRG